jgi:hypothetical protein
MCLSFCNASVNLCNDVAGVAQRLATEFVDPNGLEAFLANRLISLDKSPGVIPVGIGETHRLIIGKAISKHLKKNIVCI